MRKSKAGAVALGGMFAALSVVIMCLGGLVPLATYICPVICTMIGAFVLRLYGCKTQLTWYAAVAVLSLLMGPDKEAACIFLLLGCYPVLKTIFEKVRFSLICKILYFNASVIVVYRILTAIMGLEHLLTEFAELGLFGLFVLIVLGNITFFLLDILLKRISQMH